MDGGMSLPVPKLPAHLQTHALELPADLSLSDWERIGDFISHCDGAVQWWLGDWWRYGEHRYGERARAAAESRFAFQTCANAAWVSERIETSRRREVSWSHHAEVAALEPAEQDRWLADAEHEGWSRQELRARLRSRRALTPPLPQGTYRCIVIDPPWPMDKIVREVRPKQAAALDYPTMPLAQIDEVCGELVRRHDSTHVYLWTTQRFLPSAFELFESWDVAYECLHTWVKNVGPTPFSWMYDTEHVLFGRRGSLALERQGLRLSFSAPVLGHSIKPDVFYERVREASPGPRLEMFARRAREGFEVWGDEIAA